MGWQDLLLRLRALFGRTRADNDLDDELSFHLEMQERRNKARGLADSDAHRHAIVQFGGVERVREECRDARGVSFLEDLLRDARFGLRMLRKAPGFAAVAILSLGIGIGANTAIFSLIDAVLLRTLPVKDPGQLVVVHWGARKDLNLTMTWATSGPDEHGGWAVDVVSWPEFSAMRARTRALAGLIGFSPISNLNVVTRGQALVTSGITVSGNYFQTLGAGVLLGRPIESDDDMADGVPATVISYRMWERVFALDPSVVGRTMLINRQQCVIVGVTPREFVGVSPGGFVWAPEVDVMLPIRARDRFENAGDHLSWFGPDLLWVQTMGRLRAGVDNAAAARELSAILFGNLPEEQRRALGRDLPRILLQPGSRGLSALSSAYRNPLLILLSIVGLTLLMACANLAGLLLARASSRRKEVTLRLAMGARRARLVRQLLMEGALLSIFGAAVGALFAWWGVEGLITLASTGQTPILVYIYPDARVLAFTAAVAIAATFLFALAPAIRATRVDLSTGLKEETPAGGGRPGMLQALVGVQIAVAVLLVVGSALFSRSLTNLRSTPLGFSANRLLVFDLAPGDNGYDETRSKQFYASVLQRLKENRGVVGATMASARLMTGGVSNGPVWPEGWHSGSPAGADFNFVGPDYFPAMQIPLVVGRGIEQRDMDAPSSVAVVNEAFARKYMGGASPIGRRFRWRSDDRMDLEIVGLVKDARYAGVRSDPPATVYAPYTRDPWGWPRSMSFAVRAVTNTAEALADVRRTVHDIDPMLPLVKPDTMEGQIDRGLYQERLLAFLISLFGVLTLALACVGLFGMVSWSVASRTREIGVRVALGAGRAKVVRMVLAQVGVITAVGLAAGGSAAVALGRLMEHRLYGVKANDPLSLLVGAALIVAVALAASALPLRRALRIDPVRALRYE